jgi:hypothetical protein
MMNARIPASPLGPRLRRALSATALPATLLGLTTAVLLAAPAGGNSLASVRRPAQRPGSLAATGPLTSPTTTATVPVTATAPATPTVTATLPPSITPTATASATQTPTRAPTLPPRPAYLPVTLRDPACVPETRYSDVVFLVDVSRYMDKDANGRPGRDWAQDWMRSLVDRLDLAHGRAGVVQFNRDVTVAQQLTNDRDAVLRAITARPEHENSSTRMDVGLRVARDVLLGEGATPGNGKAILFISLMQAKGIPTAGTPCAADIDDTGEECVVLIAATEAKSHGITIFSLALSWYGNGVLKGVASDPGKNYLLPTADELGQVAGALQTVKPCAPEQFWPRAGR